MTIQVPYEELTPGPVGNYVAVVGLTTAANKCYYEPVNLDDRQF